jgi:gamma-glutamylcyclotransferase (GGCT)/AIG2-like uncharacterized protein YtfP
MLNNVFVYGTLKKNEWNDRPFYQNNRVSCKKAVVRGRIYAIATFPGVLLNDEESIVYGEVHTYPEEMMAKILACLDSLEGYQEGRAENSYNRKVVTATLENGKEIEAYIYEYSRQPSESIRIESGVWTKDSHIEVEKRNKKYLKAGR